MDKRFVDTSGWAESVDRTLIHHASAVSIFNDGDKKHAKWLTSNWVLLELTALLARPLRMPKSRQVQLLDDISNDPAIVVLAIDSEIEGRAWKLWKTRLDKDWSLVDCSSFVLMEELQIREALTSDHHFEQAGFIRLLK